MRLSEELQVVPVLALADHQAGIVGDSINGGKVHRIMFVLETATLTGDAVLRVYSGATDAAETTAETFRYRRADGDVNAAGSDQYGAWATSSALTLTAATYDNGVLIVEIDMDELTDGQPWVTLDVSAAATAFNATCVAICTPRIEAHDTGTVLT